MPPPVAVREQALAAVETAMQTLGGVTVYRNRSSRIVSLPAVNLVDGGMKADDETLGLTRYDMEFSVQGYVDPANDAAIGPAISDLQARIVEALLADPTLGGVVVDVHEGESRVDIDRGEGKAPVAMIETDFTVEFFTREGDPYATGP
ncbi:MAG: hypothetical protein AB7P02_09400 [Alphaproteobacteria bacterium]